MATPHKSIKFSTGNIVESNDDILMNILLHLPEDILMQLKLVSKRWLSLISDPYFSSLRLASKPRPTTALLIASHYCPTFCYTVALTNDYHNQLVGEEGPRTATVYNSCNGLWLLSMCGVYFLFNPTHNQLTELPPNILPEYSRFSKFLVYDPTKSYDYKVMDMRSTSSEVIDMGSLSPEVCHVDVYSSKARQWKHDIASCVVDRKEFQYRTYWNGCVHWLTHTNVLHFDVYREKFGSLGRPSATPDGYTRDDLLCEYLGESMGRLYLVEVYRNNRNRENTSSSSSSSSVLFVFEMKSFLSEWNLVHQSCFDVVLDRFPEILNPVRNFNSKKLTLLSLVSGDREDETFIIVQMRNRKCFRLIRYNICKKSFQEFFKLPALKHNCWNYVSPHMEIGVNSPIIGDKLTNFEDAYEETLSRLWSSTRQF